MITSWPSPAKLNLFLYITGRRNDGYHELQTLFQFLNYGDTINISLHNGRQIRLLTPINGIENKDNMIVRAARLLMLTAMQNNILPENSGVDITINKRLPICSGLGSGSSNAATILVALNQLWGCGLNEKELATLGLKLGADVPVFVYGYAAFAEGIGEKLSLTTLAEKWYLILYPVGLKIPTMLVFCDPELPRNTQKRPMEMLLKCKFSNDCENIVRKRFRKVDEIFLWLLEHAPQAPARLTGTGSCIFVEFDTKITAYQVLKQTPKWLYGFVAKSINISPLKLKTMYTLTTKSL